MKKYCFKVLPILIFSVLICCIDLIAASSETESSDSIPIKGLAGLYFSWDKVSRAIYISTPDEFNQEGFDFLAANYDHIVFGINYANVQYKNYDLAIANAARELKTRNSKIRVIYYISAVRLIKHYPANAEFEEHPSWALDPAEVVLTPGTSPGTTAGNVKEINLSIPEVRDWWINRVKDAINMPNIDGLFFDAVMKIYGGTSLTTLRELYPPNLFEDGLYDILDRMKNMADTSKNTPILLGNIIRYQPQLPVEKMLPYFNCCFLENHPLELGDNMGPTEFKAIIDRTYAIAKSGKSIMNYLGMGLDYFAEQTEEEKIQLLSDNLENRLAFILLTAEDSYYFDYKEGPSAKYHFWMLDLPVFKNPIGAPLEDMQINGYIYTRKFEHCTVTVNIEDMSKTKISWEDNNGVRITDIPESSLKTYPQPARDRLIIELADIDEPGSTAKFFDLTGKMVYHRQLNSNKTNIDVSGLRSGIYCLTVISSKEIFTRKLNIIR